MSKNNKDFFTKKNEWSIIKDELLKCYLKPYFQKVLTTYKPICYIDCFAGKGQFDYNNEPGSPIIALRIQNDCLKQSVIPHKERAITTTFIEQKYASELQRNIEGISQYGIPLVLSGKFEVLILDCINKHINENVFLYIDPYGIRSLDMNLLCQFGDLQIHSFEMLINFNSFGLFRNACKAMRVESSKIQDISDLEDYDSMQTDTNSPDEFLVTRVVGGDYWKGIVSRFNNEPRYTAFEAERDIMRGYKNILRKKYKYVLDMPIRFGKGNQLKYRMIHVCNHEDGCYLMAHNMQKRQEALSVLKSGDQMSFDFLTNDVESTENIIYSKNDVEKDLWGALCEYNSPVHHKSLLVDFFNKSGLIVKFDILNQMLNDWEQKGMITIQRTPAITEKGKPTKFWEENNKKSIFITRINK